MPDDPIAVGDWAWGAMKIHEIAAPLRPSESEMPNDSNDQTEISNEFK